MADKTVKQVIEKYSGKGRDALIPLLQDVQEEFGHLSKDAVIEIGREMNLPASKIFGVATFYNQFRFKKPGQYHIQVCRGTACHVKGSSEVLETLKRELSVEAGDTTKDGLFSLEVVACIGACGLAPVIAINGEFHANVEGKSVKKILKSYKNMAKAEGGSK
jgi:NADH:ubiquinone oxidoreductase subunit E